MSLVDIGSVCSLLYVEVELSEKWLIVPQQIHKYKGVKLSLCLINRHAMKMHGEMEV
jgi:hypothetical protein